MTVEERDRRLMQEALVNTIGPEPADTLMHYLPPVGWADVATKADLKATETVLRAEIASLGSSVRGEFYQALTAQTWRLITAMIAIQALSIGALKIL